MTSSARQLRAPGPHDPVEIGHYLVRALIGEGGMGRVYLASSPAGRLAAVKVVSPAVTDDPVFRERFRREVAAARRVAGAFTAPVADADPDGPNPWLATQYVPGPSLRDAVELLGPLPTDACLMLGARMLEALVAVHRDGITHRDLKPSNVLLAADGPRLIDFGIARAADQTALTRFGEVFGTAAYMSPEQAMAGDVGPASDVFAFALVLIFAATGRDPFGGGDPAGILFRIVHDEPDLGAVPEALRDRLRPCLAKDPAGRPDPAALLRRFTAGLGGAPAWPAAVARLIREREAEVAAWLPGLPSAAAAGGAVTRFALPSPAGRPVVTPAAPAPAPAPLAPTLRDPSPHGPAPDGPASPNPESPTPASPGPAPATPASPNRASPGRASPGRASPDQVSPNQAPLTPTRRASIPQDAVAPQPARAAAGHPPAGVEPAADRSPAAIASPAAVVPVVPSAQRLPVPLPGYPPLASAWATPTGNGPDDAFVFTGRRWTNVVAGVLLLLASIVALLIVLSCLGTLGNDAPTVTPGARFGSLLVGVGAGYLTIAGLRRALWRLRLASDPPWLSVTSAGIQARAGGRRYDVPWSQARGARVIRLGSREVVAIWPTPEWALRTPHLDRPTWWIPRNRNLCIWRNAAMHCDVLVDVRMLYPATAHRLTTAIAVLASRHANHR